MTARIPMLVTAAAAVVAAAACSGGGGGGRDYGAPSATYPAPHAKLPAVIDHGGPKLTAPKLVAITYDGDPYQAQLDDFVANVGASSWWMAVTSGYGVGPVVSTTSVHIAEAAPSYILKSDMEAWLASHLDGSDPSWPQPDPQTLYVLFYPAGTTVDDPGSNGMGPSCQYWYAYHYQIASGVWYAVMPECPVYGSNSELDVLTSDASHELIEAATDPDAFNPAWDGVANGFAAWGLQDEVGDLCEAEPDADYKPADLPYKVQRSWSNVAAAAGSDPCAPETYPFFGAAPKELPSISIDFGPGSTLDTFGVQVKKGASKTLELDYFSDQPTGPIHLSVRELLIDAGQTPAIAVTLDHPDGVNGEKAYLTLTGLGATSLPGGLDFVTITAEMGGFEHSWPLWVVTQ